MFPQRGAKKGLGVGGFSLLLVCCGCSQSLCRVRSHCLCSCCTPAPSFSPMVWLKVQIKPSNLLNTKVILSPGESSAMLCAHCCSFVSAGTSPVTLICLGKLFVFMQSCSCTQQILSLPFSIAQLSMHRAAGGSDEAGSKCRIGLRSLQTGGTGWDSQVSPVMSARALLLGRRRGLEGWRRGSRGIWNILSRVWGNSRQQCLSQHKQRTGEEKAMQGAQGHRNQVQLPSCWNQQQVQPLWLCAGMAGGISEPRT